MARILIVDDLQFMRSLLRRILEDQGYEVVGEAANGREGVLAWDSLKPDLVILDITMPVMDGLSALQKIRSLDPQARVLMCSALSEREQILRAIQLGARDYVVKPFREERIHHAVQRALPLKTGQA